MLGGLLNPASTRTTVFGQQVVAELLFLIRGRLAESKIDQVGYVWTR